MATVVVRCGCGCYCARSGGGEGEAGTEIWRWEAMGARWGLMWCTAVRVVWLIILLNNLATLRRSLGTMFMLTILPNYVSKE